MVRFEAGRHSVGRAMFIGMFDEPSEALLGRENQEGTGLLGGRKIDVVPRLPGRE